MEAKGYELYADLLAADAYAKPVIEQFRISYELENIIDTAMLQSCLCTIGAIYLSQRAIASESNVEALKSPARTRYRRELTAISKSAIELQSRMARLEKPASDMLWIETTNNVLRLASAYPEFFGGEMARYGKIVVPAFLLNSTHLNQALTVIEKLATDAAERFKGDEGGRPENQPLLTWADNLAEFWTKVLRQKFTVTCSDTGISESVKFFAAVMAPLDPKVSETAIFNVMRKVHDLGIGEPTRLRNNPAATAKG